MAASDGIATLEAGSFGLGAAIREDKAGDSSIDFMLGARVDQDWVLRKFRTQFNAEVIRKLKNAVYGIGQGGQRWFSGGGELSSKLASMILDYWVLIELLLESRSDLGEYRGDLLDCREQLRMQVSRYTEGQPDRVDAVVDVLVRRFQQRLGEDRIAAK